RALTDVRFQSRAAPVSGRSAHRCCKGFVGVEVCEGVHWERYHSASLTEKLHAPASQSDSLGSVTAGRAPKPTRYERIAVLGRLRGVVMREIKLTSLVFLAGLAIAACSGSDDGDDEATGTGGSGVGAMPGTGGGTTDPGTGGGTTDPGSGGSTSASTCEGNVVK